MIFFTQSESSSCRCCHEFCKLLILKLFDRALLEILATELKRVLKHAVLHKTLCAHAIF